MALRASNHTVMARCLDTLVTLTRASSAPRAMVDLHRTPTKLNESRGERYSYKVVDTVIDHLTRT